MYIPRVFYPVKLPKYSSKLVILFTYLPMKLEQPGCSEKGHVSFRSRRITLKKAYNIQNRAKVWNKENLYVVYFVYINSSYFVISFPHFFLFLLIELLILPNSKSVCQTMNLRYIIAKRKGFFDNKSRLSFFSGLRRRIKSVPIYVQNNKHWEILHYNSSLPKAKNCTIYLKEFFSPVITTHRNKLLL